MQLAHQHSGIYCRNIEESVAFYEEVFGCKVLFRSDAMEGDKPLKMAWIKGAGAVFELLEAADKTSCDAAAKDNNHLAFRVDDIEAFASFLREKGIAIEAGPFEPPLSFDRPLSAEDGDLFRVYGKDGLNLKILFFRGPGGERFEVLQDNIGAL